VKRRLIQFKGDVTNVVGANGREVNLFSSIMGPARGLAFRIHQQNISPGEVGISAGPESASAIKSMDCAHEDQTSPNMPNV
jgi:hypothetical protein